MLDIYYGELKIHVSKQQESYDVGNFLSKYSVVLSHASSMWLFFE